MKLFKKLLSYIIAFTMVLSLATLLGGNVYATDQDGLKITINAKEAGHIFEAYQIFTGDVDTNTPNSPENTNNKILSNIQWGDAITAKSSELVQDLKTNDTLKNDFNFAEGTTVKAKDVADKLSKLNDAEKLNTFAKLVAKCLDSAKAHTSIYDKTAKKYTINGLKAGYYLVQDKAGSITGNEGVTDKAYTAYILNVVGNTNVKEKSDIPTVDKKVEQFADNDVQTQTGNPKNEFKDNADHEIGRTFKFKLAATVPADVHVSSYDSYELKFNDTMSEGITFEQIDSVVLSDGTDEGTVTVNPYSESNKDGYITDKGKNALTNGGVWSLTIPDIKKFNLDLSKAITATVIYDAHLNENAFVNTTTGETATKNENDVELEYSNNPNASGLGKTNKKDVYVFAYGINSTKRANSDTGSTLSGAKFTIKRESKDGSKLKFKQVTTDKETYYLLTTDAVSEENHVSTTVTSGSDGKFNIRGLDEGTYYFEETEAPAGYNTVDPFTVKITPTLGTGANISKASYIEYSNYDANAETHPVYNNIVVDKSGSTLPSTGGMGTTLLYVAGGILVACAAAYVVLNKKRA